MRRIVLVAGAGLALLAAHYAEASGVNFNDTASVPVTNNAPTLTSPVFTGNVGVGTTSAQTTLAVLGNVGIGTWTADGGALIVNGGGNVGIGTAWPGQKLDVAGSVRATSYSGDGSGLTGISYAPAGGRNAVQYSDGATVQGNESIFSFNGTNVGIGTSNGTQLLDVRGNTMFSGNVGIATVVTSYNGLSILNGNMGIGTWVPSSLVNIKGQSPAITLVDGNGYSGDLGLATTAGDFAPYSSAGDLVLKSNAGQLVLASGTAIVWGSTSSELMRLDTTTGNLGLGTVSPASPLVVAGSGVGIGTGMNSLYARTAAPSGGLIVEGNVGLGTSAPQTALAVLGNMGVGTWTADGGSLIVRGGNMGVGSVAPGAALEVVGMGTTSATSNVIVRDSAKNIKLTILDNGNIGIGTFAPNARLHIHRDAGNSIVHFTNAQSGNNTGGYIGLRGGNDLYYMNEKNAGVIVASGNTVRISIGPTGNVGIGTQVQASPFARLSINNGVLNSSGSSPSLSGCGAGPSVTGTDSVFTMTGGAGAAGCTATFAAAKVKTPVCVATPNYATSTSSYTVSTSALTYTDASLGTQSVTVVCIGLD